MFCNTPRQAHSSQCTLPLTIIGTSAILLLLGLLLACFLACFVSSSRVNRSRRSSKRTATVLCSGIITTFKYSENVPSQSIRYKGQPLDTHAHRIQNQSELAVFVWPYCRLYKQVMAAKSEAVHESGQTNSEGLFF